MLRKHGVSVHELEEVLGGQPQVRTGKKKDGEQRYYVVGRTEAGRKLIVIFRLFAGTGEIITAWEV